MSNNHYNNIFNKKNIEYQLDGQNKTLPYTKDSDISLKSNQIIFTSINNIFQKLLDNDLYNETLLKKYIDSGVVGGPIYTNSIKDVENNLILGKKYVVSGENEISVLRKEEIDVSETFSKRYLDGTKVNKIDFINERFVACTENGIYESVDKRNWTKRIGEKGIDVVDICYNQNFLNGSIISTYDYIAIANKNKTIIFYGHDGISKEWKNLSENELSNIVINSTANRIFSFANDKKLYIGTKNGLFSSELLTPNSTFTYESGTNKLVINDMVTLQDVDEYEKYIIASNNGIKQSKKLYGFNNLRNKYSNTYDVNDAIKCNDIFYVALQNGLVKINNNNKDFIKLNENDSIQCYALLKENNSIYVGTDDGLYSFDIDGDTNVRKITLPNDEKSIIKLCKINRNIFAATNTEIFSIKGNDIKRISFTGWNDYDEYIKQIKAYNKNLYVVSNKNIYVVKEFNNVDIFIPLEISIETNENNVKFARNVSDNEIIAQIDNDIYLLTINEDLTNPSSSSILSTLGENEKILDAIKNYDNAKNYFILTDEKICSITIIDGEAPSVLEYSVNAKRISYFSYGDLRGIVYIDSNDSSIKFLECDEQGVLHESDYDFNNVKNVKDIATYNDSIYAINTDNKIIRLKVEKKLSLKKEETINNNGISLKEFKDFLGFVEENNRKNDGYVYNGYTSYLSTFTDKINLNILQGDNELTKTIDNINSGHFIGYIKNNNEKKSLLIGKHNESNEEETGLYLYNVDIENGNITCDSEGHKILNEKVNAFADVSYRINDNERIENAFTFFGTDNGLIFLSSNNEFVKDKIPNEITTINDYIDIDDRNRYIATNNGIYQYNTSDDDNFVKCGIDNNVNRISKYKTNDETILIATGSGNSILLSGNTSTDESLPYFSNVFYTDDEDNEYFTITDNNTNISAENGYVFDVETEILSGIKDNSNSIFTDSTSLTSIEITDINNNKTYLKSSLLSSIYFDNENNIEDKNLSNIIIDDIFGRSFKITRIDVENNKICLTEFENTQKDIGYILSKNLANNISVSNDLSIVNDQDKIFDYYFSEIIASSNEVSSNKVEINGVENISFITNEKEFTLLSEINSDGQILIVENWSQNISIDGDTFGIKTFEISTILEISFGYQIYNPIILNTTLNELDESTINKIIDDLSTLSVELSDLSESSELSGIKLSLIIKYYENSPDPNLLKDLLESIENSLSVDSYISSITTILSDNINVETNTEINHSFNIENILTRYNFDLKNDGINGLRFKTYLSIGNIVYESDALSSKLVLNYNTGAEVYQIKTFSKKTIPLQTTNDGIYLDNIYYNKIENDETLKQTINGFIVKFNANDTNNYLLLTENGLYYGTNFNIKGEKRKIGILHIKTIPGINDQFNDVYYFRVDEKFSEYQVRKLLESQHNKDFLIAKSESEKDIDGNISHISLENNILYIISNNKLKYTTPEIFPKFKDVFNNESYNTIDIRSCDSYSLAIVENNNTNNIFKIKFEKENENDKEYHITTISLRLEEQEQVKNLFVSNNNVYVKTTNEIFYINDNIKTTIDFTKDDIVIGYLPSDSFFNSDVVICNNSLCYREQIYDFSKEDNYKQINLSDTLNESDKKIVDIKAFKFKSSNGSNSIILLVAKENEIGKVIISNIGSTIQTSYTPLLTSNEDSEGENFKKIKGIYLNDINNELYVIDGKNIFVFKNLSINGIISLETSIIDYNNEKIEDFLSEESTQITINTFKNYNPVLVKSDSYNEIAYLNKFIQSQSEILKDISLNKFIYENYPKRDSNLFVYSDKKIFKLDIDDSNNFSFNNLCNENIECQFSDGIDYLEKTSNSEYTIWVYSKNNYIDSKIHKYKIINNSSIYNYTFDVLNSPLVNNIFKYNNKYLLATENGFYSLESINLFKEDENNPIHEIVKNIINNNKNNNKNTEFFAIELLNNDDYLFSYSTTNNENNVKSNILYSNDTELMEFLGNNYSIQATIITKLFNKYLFISNRNEGYVLNLNTEKGYQINFSQLDAIVNNSYLMNFIKDDNIGLIGFGNTFEIFDDFSFYKGYGNINSKFVALINNFKSDVNKIEILNDQPDFLIGTTFGLKYVYDDLMTRSFYNKETNVNINKNINSFKKVLVDGINDYYIVGQKNSLFEVTSLKGNTYRKIYEFDENENILDIFTIQKNEYIISTTKGIYTTELKYKLINDLKRFTINNIYDIINDELRKIISKHIEEEHTSNSLITNINNKSDNRLSFISTEDKHEKISNIDVINQVNIIKDDIIDTIDRGGETENDESFVKVGINNWVLEQIETKSTYTNDGFINGFIDPTSNKEFDITRVPYIVKNWKSGLKEIYIYVPTTGTYYINNPQGISNSEYTYTKYERENVPGSNLTNTLPTACTTLRVYLYNSYFNIKRIISVQCAGNSLPLKIYKDNVNADDNWKGVFDTVIQPTVLRTLPIENAQNVNNINNCIDDMGRICLEFSIYGSDAQAIRIIAES